MIVCQKYTAVWPCAHKSLAETATGDRHNTSKPHMKQKGVANVSARVRYAQTD